MLKIYDKLDDVPEGLREHYKLVEGKYVPELSTDHPVLANNRKLLSEKDAAETKAADLQAQVESAKANGLPRGHVAVPRAEADLLNEVKTLGNVADVKAKLAEHETLKTKVAETERTDTRRKVAGVLGYNEAAFLQLSNLPDFEIRDKDGKQSVIALVKDGDKVVEKAGGEYVEATYAPLLPALKTKSGTEVPTSGTQGTQSNADPFARAREWANNYNKQSGQAGSVEQRFGLAPAPPAN